MKTAPDTGQEYEKEYLTILSPENKLFAIHYQLEGRALMKKICLIVWLLFLSIFMLWVGPQPLYAEEGFELTDGQTIYVPVYSHIYIGNREKPFLLAATLSIRNIDPKYPISIIVVDYYETQGKFLKKYLDKPVTLNPLESIRYIIPERDKTGGSGANFIVEWKSDKYVNPPIVESIMIGAQSSQGISFTSRGRAIIPSK